MSGVGPTGGLRWLLRCGGRADELRSPVGYYTIALEDWAQNERYDIARRNNGSHVADDRPNGLMSPWNSTMLHVWINSRRVADGRPCGLISPRISTILYNGPIADVLQTIAFIG